MLEEGWHPTRANNKGKLTGQNGFYTYTKANLDKEYYIKGRLVKIEKNDGTLLHYQYEANQLVGYSLQKGTQALPINHINRVANGSGSIYSFGFEGQNYAFNFDASERLLSIKKPTPDSDEFDTITLHYDDTRNPLLLTSIKNEQNAVVLSYAYDEYGRVTETNADPATTPTSIAYGVDGLRTVTDKRGRLQNYTFENGRISSIDCPACGDNKQLREFDGSGRLSSQTDFNGTTTEHIRNAQGLDLFRFSIGENGESTFTQYQWDTEKRLPLSITKDGKKTEYTYNDKGWLTSRTFQEQRKHLFEYDAFGNLIKMDGPRTDVNDITLSEYTDQGFKQSVTNALAQKPYEVLAHDVLGRPTSIKSANGLITNYTLNLRGQPTQIQQGSRSTILTYNKAGLLITKTNPEGVALTHTYDRASRLKNITGPQGNQFNIIRDLRGNVISTEIMASDGTVHYREQTEYNELSQVSKAIQTHSETRFAYDAMGNLVSETDKNNDKAVYLSDGFNRPIKTTDKLQGSIQNRYDSAGNRVKVTDPENKATQYKYNSFNEVKKIISPDTGVTNYTYDVAGNLLTKTDARDVTTIFTYDALNRVLTQSYSDASENIVYHYDDTANGNKGIGQLTSVTDQTGSTHYFYNAFGQVTKETRVIEGKNYVTEYHFDSNGQATGITYPSGRVISYSFDSLARVNGVTSTYQTQTKTLASNIEYLPFGPMTSLTYGNGKVMTQAFDLDYRLTDKSTTGIHQMTYDLNNNITSITNPTDANNTQSFSYDKLSRLLTANGEYGDLGFAYDKVGNRLNKTDNADVDSYVYATNSHQLASVTGSNAKTFTRDAIGNTLTKNDLTFTYNQQGRLATASKAGMNAEYRYNFKGERSSKLVNGIKTHFIYDLNGQLIAEADESGVTTTEYVYQGTEPLAKMTYSATQSAIVSEETTNQQWKTHQFPTSVTSPVVLVGTPTHHGSDRGVVAVQNITSDSVDVRFAEWDYLDGNHAQESMSIVALPQGRHVQADGSIWEVGTVDISGDRQFTTVNFSQAFTGQPTLILTPQTSNDASAFTVSSKQLTESGFKVAIFEEEANKNSSHATETIGYVVVYSANNQGTAEFNGLSFNYHLVSDTLKNKWKTIAGYELRVEEEKSADNEVRHVFENIHAILINGHLFAQIVSTKGGDTTNLRRRTDTPTIIGGNNIYYYHNDHLGTPKAITDKNQVIVWQATHTPFGKATVSVNTFENNIRFPGQYFDQETELHYNYFRDYDPEIGRYIQSDPIGLAGWINTLGMLGGIR